MISKNEVKSDEIGQIHDLVLSIRHVIMDNLSRFEEVKETEDIIESRFMSTEKAMEEGYISCGIVTNIATEILRKKGFSVKKVHGYTDTTPTHAWISVENPITKEWEDYDLEQKDCTITENHVELARCDDWEEIRSLIETEKGKYH